MKKNIKSLPKDQLISWLAQKDIAPYRAGQILKWVYGRLVEDFEEMTDLSKALRGLLADHFEITPLKTLDRADSGDGTRKYLFGLKDANRIETVLIPERGHCTLCVSTQVGCAQGCRFCRTGQDGFVRNLTCSEIVTQVLVAKKELAGPLPLTNIVFMGMGEPLANFQNLVAAIEILTDQQLGLQFANRRITVSTVGLAPMLDGLGQKTRVNLAVSLNAADNPTRDRLMPVNRKYPLEDLLEACRRYNLLPHRRITFEYILLKNINDSPQDAARLVKRLRPIKAKINLIPFNEFEGTPYRRPEDGVIEAFQEILIRNNYTAIIRKSKGADIAAACGQLRSRQRYNSR